MPDPVSRVLQLRDAGGFQLSERLHQPAWSWSRHAHERPSISLILAGECTEQLGRFGHQCTPATMHVLPAGEIHGFRFVAPVRCLTIEVELPRAESLREASAILQSPRQFRDMRFIAMARQLTREMHIRDDAAELSMESLVLALLAHGERASAQAKPPRWLAAVRDALHAQFRERVTLTGLAGIARVHPSYLARAFRTQYGCTVGEYVRRLRLDFAAAELLDVDKAISDVAAEAGFFDQSHFAHLFRRHTGMTPSAFRAARKSN
jgi:AraC family transcriptional regulator